MFSKLRSQLESIKNHRRKRDEKDDNMQYTDFIAQFRDIDPPLQNYFVRTLFSELFMFFVLLLVCIAFKQPFLFLCGSIMILILTGMLFYRIQRCLENTVCRLEGVCEEVFVPSILKKKFLARDYLILRTEDDNFVKIFNVKHYKAQVDNTLVVYFPQGCIRRINDDTYQIYSFYWIYIARRKAKNIRQFFNKRGSGN